MLELYQPPKPAIILPGEPWERMVTRDLALRGFSISKRQDIVRALRGVIGSRKPILRATISDLEQYSKAPLLAFIPSLMAKFGGTGTSSTFPVVVNTNTLVQDTQVTSHPVNLPASLVSGNVLIVFISAQAANRNFTTPSGWTQLWHQANGAGQGQQACYYKTSDGSEGATVSITSDFSCRSAAVSYQISGASGTITGSGNAYADAGADTSIGAVQIVGGMPSVKKYLVLSAISLIGIRDPTAIPGAPYATKIAAITASASGASMATVRAEVEDDEIATINQWEFTSSRYVRGTLAVHPV